MAIRSFEGISPRLGRGAYVDETALVIGDVALGEDSSIWPMCVVRGDVNPIRIGARSNIQDGCVLHVTHAGEQSSDPQGSPLIIGNEVTVGHRAVLHACTVEDRCLIGMGAQVLDRAVIRTGAMVGAGALIPPNAQIEGGYLWVGVPARRLRSLTARERDYLVYSATHYVRLKDRHSR
jgi:carbonic anhydrase/acetyltransferase-like protein (isoleucine patch superfamily)